MTDEETKEYWEFMFDPENILECEKCPENKNPDAYKGGLPCKEFQCLVLLRTGLC